MSALLHDVRCRPTFISGAALQSNKVRKMFASRGRLPEPLLFFLLLYLGARGCLTGVREDLPTFDNTRIRTNNIVHSSFLNFSFLLTNIGRGVLLAGAQTNLTSGAPVS